MNENEISETWETVECLSNVRADYITGRATRVWKVQRVNPLTSKPDGTVKVLKDCWIERNRVSEGDRYRQIARWLREHPEYNHLSRHFFTFHAEEAIRIGDMEDSTFLRLRGGLVPTEESSLIDDFNRLAISRELVSYSRTLQESIGPVPEISQVKVKHFVRPAVDRLHSRLIVDESGLRIDELKTFGEVYKSVMGANGGKVPFFPTSNCLCS